MARKRQSTEGRIAANNRKVANNRKGMSWSERELLTNALISRSELIRKWMDPRRDIDAECGYRQLIERTPAFYRELYDTDTTAARVVEVLPKESWKVPPLVYEDEDADTETEFEKAWDELGSTLRGKSYHKQEEGSKVWEYLKRADILSGIGRYGVLLLGFDDGKPLSEPVAGIDNKGQPTANRPKNVKLLYVRPLDESLAEITKYETDANNPRYGQPVEYLITLSDPKLAEVGIGLSTATERVHWTRVIHIADNKTSSEVFAIPRCQQPYKRLADLIKVYGGSAEMYWRGAFPGMTIETQPNLGGGGTPENLSIDLAATRAEISNYFDGLQRAMLLMGLTAKSHAPQVSDPTAQIDIQLTAICILLAIPKRIFMGSERGELASSQDERSWNDRLMERRTTYLTPDLICPFVDRLIMAGVLPEPAEGYIVEWPDIEALTAQEQAQLSLTLVEAIAKYIQAGADVLLPPMEFLTRILKFSEEEAQAILDAAIEHITTANPEADQEIVPGRNPTPPELEDPSLGNDTENGNSRNGNGKPGSRVPKSSVGAS